MNKRRLPIFFAVAIFVLSSIFAVDGKIGLTPYTGMYGINMASMKYQGGTDNWIEKNVSTITPEESRSLYTNDHIIALGGIYDLNPTGDISSENTSFTVTVYSSNGLYFRSLSHPSCIRPFYFKLIARYDGIGTGEVFEIKETGHPTEIKWNDKASSDSTRMWFDLILVLPNDSEPVANSGFIMADGIQYSLMQATDYTALVTIELSFNGKSQSISIPFSGFYNGDIDSPKGENKVSLMFTPTGQAANMMIGNHSNIPVGHIDFMMDVTTDGGKALTNSSKLPDDYNYHRDSDVRLFLSASSDPTTSNETFLLRHSSVRSNTVLTDYNSIGFSVIARGEESDGKGSGKLSSQRIIQKTREFDGSDCITADGKISNDNAVYPVRNVTREEEAQTVTSRNVREFFEYHGDIEVVIDNPTTIMLPGAYTSEVYIHVVAEDGRV